MIAVLAAACSRQPARDASVDLQISAAIAGIRAIDHHAHPVRPVTRGEAPDLEFDALPVESLEPASDPIRLRPMAAGFAEASRELSNIDRSAQDYAVRVLDKIGAEKMFANRVAMGPGLPPSRFVWVAYADALMYPLANDALLVNSDRKAFFALEERLLKRYYAESRIAARPASLEEYLSKVVRPTLERHKQGGAVAEKFEMAYLRSLAVGNPARAEAEKAWAGTGDYRALQDFIFRFIATECGRLGMAVHFHTGAGAGGYFDETGASPMLLEPLLNDPSLRKTNFVMVHGGWPSTSQVTALLGKPTAYLDFSVQAFLTDSADLGLSIRGWLEFVPEKVMFGTDAYPYSPEAGWEETAYVASKAGREALGRALTGMLRDGEISQDRAAELARMVLRDNARKLYGWH